MTATQPVTDALLRFHRKNPLRAAFGTDVLIAEHGADEIEQAYEQLAKDGLVEPVYHRVVRAGKERVCYKITKAGMGDSKKK